jgi:hypothetical protein
MHTTEEPAGTQAPRWGPCASRPERLTGQHRLVALQRIRAQQPEIGRHDVAHRELHDVTRNKGRHIDGDRLGVTQGQRLVTQLRVQLLEGARRAVLVHES